MLPSRQSAQNITADMFVHQGVGKMSLTFESYDSFTCKRRLFAPVLCAMSAFELKPQVVWQDSTQLNHRIGGVPRRKEKRKKHMIKEAKKIKETIVPPIHFSESSEGDSYIYFLAELG